MKRENTGLVFLIILLLVVVVGINIYMLVDKYSKVENVTNTPPAGSSQNTTEKNQEDTTTVKQEDSEDKYSNAENATNTPPANSSQNTTEKNQESTTTVKQEDSYETFLANTKKIREKYTLRDYAAGSLKPYSVTLDKNGNLYVDDSLLDSSVVLFFIINCANGGYEYVHYIKEDGSVYSSNSGYAIHANLKLEGKKLKFNRIVNIIQGATEGANYPIYIDIDGNTFRD